jgi:O-antigen ligase
VGSYSALVMIILAAAALRVPGWRRWLYTFGMFAAGAGLYVSRTRTAAIAVIVGFAVLVIAMSVKRAAILAAALAVAFGVAYMLDAGGVRRVVSIPDRITARDMEVATSGRLTPALVALAMFRDHPVTGVGPGAFRYGYMPYQAQVRERYDTALPGSGATNFAETHNDHLQMLAETGLPGYALFVAAITAIIMHTRRSPAGDVRGAAMKGIVPPLAATFLMLALGQFPLHVPITRHLLMTMAGLAIGWSTRWSHR